jgi:predicted RNA-binding Zn ribbon-like protein
MNLTIDNLNLDIPTLFVGGRLCLDFINTAFRRRDVAIELLGSAAELRRWLYLAEGVTGMSLCPDDSAWDEGYGERVLPRAIALRTALRDLILSVLEGAPAATAALETVNAVLRDNPAYAQITWDGEGFKKSISVRHPDDRWLVAIARDALDLFCDSDLSLLRQCENSTCVRVFYDTTKNHRRRWCVEKCGSKSKAAAYYRRKVARAAQEADFGLKT